eukprot:gnl/TRDRNA2_/TRDRNA2_167864_c1_seq1.p1 gnl/TRDRNA2_/TRDRNA2_167864_c1~~gnl/TRDRNA2_/TRDRNA2_167864_c1_seq1.p1  ORF type:complete len:355 (+),score=65.59 gnl/TRDRNA2_/TRDRNA2_167864_c1_seq1:91-1065(+)
MCLVDKDGGWRTVILLQLFPGCVLLLGMGFLPRSPRWLVKKGATDEALAVLQSLRGNGAEAHEEFEEIVAANKASAALGEPQWHELVEGRTGKLLALGVSLQLIQQLVGMNAFMYFGPEVFKSLGVDADLFQTIQNAVNFFSTFPAVYLADIYGRRGLLISSSIGMTVSCIVMGIIGGLCMTRKDDDWEVSSRLGSAIIVMMVMTFIVNFAYGWGPIVWVYCAEIFPLKHRARCLGLTAMSNWVGNYLIAQFTPYLLDSIGFSTFFIYGGFCLLSLRLAIWLPETKGKMLEHINEVFDERFCVGKVIKDFESGYGTACAPPKAA